MKKLRKKAPRTRRPRPEDPSVGLLTIETVRLAQREALDLHRLANEEGLAAGEAHLRMLRPQLSPRSVHEVAWRCQDPAERGGVETGEDPQLGPYADIHVTA